MSDERAVEAIQLSQPAQTQSPLVSIAYYEPHQLAELTKHGRLYVLADGSVGAAFGYAVSQYIVRKTLHTYFTSDTIDPKARLLEVIQQTNADIVERNAQHPQRRNMAASLVAALIHNDKLIIANIGDNQVYVAWDQDIERLIPESPTSKSSPDQSLPQALPSTSTPTQKMPDIQSPENKTKQEKESASTKIPPLQTLGASKDIQIETFSRRLFPGDTVILCSGGLSGYITDQEIVRAVSRHPFDQAIRRLLALSEERGNRDHTAISISRVLSSPAASKPPLQMTLPSAPNWSEWESAPKPPSKTATQPSGKVIPTPKAKPALDQSRFQPLEVETQIPWRGCALIGGAIILLCAILLLTGFYLIPPNTLASVPIIGEMAASLAPGNDDRPIAINLPTEEIDPQENQEEAENVLSEPSPATENSSSPTTASTLVIESNSPLAPPDSTFNSPINTPVSPISTPTRKPESTGDSISVAATTPLPATATPTPTALPTIELPASCENKGRFRQDVTVPDGTQFAAAEPFEKVWLLQNAGSCPWGPGYTVRHIGGDVMGPNTEAPILDVVDPDSNGEIRVSMIAPAASGDYRGEWQMFDQNGEPFGPVMYLEIEVVQADAAAIDDAGATTLYDFIENSGEATWSSNGITYTPAETEIEPSLDIPLTQGFVAIGSALLRGNVESSGNVLLTYPDRTVGFIEGRYSVETALQPTDALAATLGFIKLPILPDDGVTFEVVFTPTDGAEQVILSQVVQYQDSPLTVLQPLSSIEAGQSGTFTLRVLGSQSGSQEWAVWIDARIIRPQ